MLNAEMQRMIFFNFPHYEQRLKKYIPQRLQYFRDVDGHIGRLRKLVEQRIEDVENNTYTAPSAEHDKDLLTIMVEGLLSGTDNLLTTDIILVNYC